MRDSPCDGRRGQSGIPIRYNKLVSEKSEIVANAETIRETLCRTDALEEEKRSLENDMAVLAGMVQNIIGENARIAQNQGEYQERYNGLVERYDLMKGFGAAWWIS